jgi:tetratricopeptide (TPR) repeat protein
LFKLAYRRRLRLVTVAVAALAWTGSAHAAAPEPSGIHWEKTLAGAFAKARAAGKPVMVDFWAEWCGWCHELDRTTYTDPQVVKLSRQLVAVKVNSEGSRPEVRAAERYGVESLPTIVFLTPSGRLFLRSEGFQNAERFADILNRVSETGADLVASDQALQKNPNDVAALAKLGAHLFDQEIFEESRDLLRKAAVKDAERPAPERKRTRVLLGIIQTYDRKYADSERLLKEALALTPADPEEDATAHYALGKTYAKWGKRDLAQTSLQKAIDAQPDGPMAPRAKEALAALPAK